jgi:RHS repeat-associated protein
MCVALAAQFNGNISQQIWATSTTARHAYGYTYDALNQLSIAEYEKYAGSWNQDAGRFNESATYDLNGNILTMVRGGATAWASGAPTAYGTMDNLSMTYNGNKLIGSNDAVADIPSNKNYDFSDHGFEGTVQEGSPATHEYLYDVNGNMTLDKNKHMTVAYNYLNLPTTVDFGGGNKIEWAYTVTGAKLRKTVYTNGTVTLTQDYVSGFVYKNGSLDFFATETGRVKVQSGGTLRHEYNLTDHLGNVRATFADNGVDAATVIEESHYYAFGMRIEGLSTSNPDNKFTYNGKELEDDHGLNWYHYGARFYDAQIGRWHAVDPIDEFQSPYAYVGNDPINLVDPDGMGADDPPELKAAIDAGHGGDAVGTSATDANGITWYEKDFTSVMAEGAVASLFYQGLEFYRTRSGDATVANSDRITNATKEKTNIYVSFHVNADPAAAKKNVASTMSGIIFFYKPGDQESKVAAEVMAAIPALRNHFDKIRVEEGNVNREWTPGVVSKEALYIHQYNSGAAVLIEVGYINNPRDLEVLKNHGSDIGMAIGVGIGDYQKSKSSAKP